MLENTAYMISKQALQASIVNVLGQHNLVNRAFCTMVRSYNIATANSIFVVNIVSHLFLVPMHL